MVPCPLGIRLDPEKPPREQIREAASWGAKGVVLDATGDLSPARLSETGRREFRHLLRSVELSLTALNLPTRRPFDTIDQLDDRLRRAEAAFRMAYELDSKLVLARVGGIPAESSAEASETFLGAIRELGRRAERHGIRLAIETGPDSGQALRGLLDAMASHGLAASIDPQALLEHGHEPGAAIQEIGPWVAHAYASDTSSGPALSPFARRTALPSSAIPWEEYLGSLEEVNYRGFLTVWPDFARPVGPQFTMIRDTLARL